MIRERTAAGRDYLDLVTQLLQRARLADPGAGLWEAADLQWWWRQPRSSDGSSSSSGSSSTGRSSPSSASLPARTTAAETRGWTPPTGRPSLRSRTGSRSSTGSGKRGPIRCGAATASRSRLRECSLYDPSLDLAVVAEDGDTAGYALFWLDPVTNVGLVEPMRVEDAYQRRGLARALLTEGLERLARRGASRLKVGYGTEPARALYTGARFRIASTDTTWRLARRGG